MVEKSKGENRQNILLPIAVAFLCGFIAGVGFTVFKMDTGKAVATNTATQQQNQGNNSSQEQLDAIRSLESRVTTNPEDVQSWTSLGHLYYDTNQPKSAIKAYNKVIELGGESANILTDLGVMHRRIEQPEKAVEYFDQAAKLDAEHIHSRLNKGIVLYYDLNQQDGAYAAWQEVIEIDPNTRLADGTLLKDAMAMMKKEK